MPYDTDMQEMISLPADARKFIPQRPPFVFVSRLMEYGEKYAETEFDVPSDCVLASAGVLYEGGMAEFMAQSCAVYAGYRDFLAGKTEPSIGVLGALSSMRLDFLPPVGATLRCRVDEVGDFDGMLMFKAKVSLDGRPAGECRLTTSGLHG